MSMCVDGDDLIVCRPVTWELLNIETFFEENSTKWKRIFLKDIGVDSRHCWKAQDKWDVLELIL
jgi:hypothetical protein